jgi:CheY-like chemotaxis protein
MARVLIVDDEPAVIQMIGCVLEIRGYEVIGAGNGREALTKMETAPPDLIITDLVMPGMNGLDLCWKIKDDPRWSGIPIMIVTSATNDSDLADGFWKLGTPADAFVSKPFDPFEMADRVERMIRNRGSKDAPDGTA